MPNYRARVGGQRPAIDNGRVDYILSASKMLLKFDQLADLPCTIHSIKYCDPKRIIVLEVRLEFRPYCIRRQRS